MDDTKQTSTAPEKNIVRRAYWGTMTLAGIVLAVSIYFLNVIAQLPGGTLFNQIATALFLSSAAAEVASILFTFRHRQELGVFITLYTLYVIGITASMLFQGRTATASFSILLASVMAILWLLPRTSRRLFSILTAATMAAMWITEWINPPWRLQIEAANIGPAGAVVFGVILVILLLTQSWGVLTRRFLSFPLRTKFLISIIGITGLSVLILGLFVFYRTQQSQLFWSNELQITVQQQSTQQTIDIAQLEAQTANQTLSQVTYAVEQLANYRAALYTKPDLLGQGVYWNADTNLITFSGGQYGTAPSEIASVFIPNTVTLSQSLITDLNASRYLDFSAPAVLAAHPNVVALYFISTNNFTVYYPNIDLANNVPPDFDATAQPFFTIAAPENDPEHKPMWTEPYQDPAGTGLIVTNAVPVYDQNNRFRGVLAADIQLAKISQQVSALKLGESGFAFMIDPDGHILAMPEAGYKLFDIQPEVVPVNESPKTTLLGIGAADFQDITRRMTIGDSGLATATIQDTPYYVAYAPLTRIGYSIGLIVPTAELDATYVAAQNRMGNETRLTTNLLTLLLVVVLLMAGGLSIFLSRFITRPLVQLTQVAADVSRGNLNAKAEAQTTDEVGALATTFNAMTTQLRETFATLEARVAERTHSLELAAEVGRSVSHVRDLEGMLHEAAEIIRSRFDLYYVQVYLTDPSRTNLVLLSGTGTVGAELLGRGHSLPLNATSINGRAAVEKRPLVISDTTASATFRPNPLLPDTRSEMAVPLMVGENVVGVLDLQSNEVGALNEGLLPAFEALAGQLAIAIQNARLLAETEEARAEVEKQARRLVRTGWDEYLDAIHKPEQSGFVFEKNKVKPLAENDIQPPADGNVISTPIAVTGEPLGSLVVELPEENQTPQNTALIQSVARQVAQQIENLRLLESAERYRAEAEETVRRTTIEGWKQYFDTKKGETLGFLYDAREVHPKNDNDGQQAADAATFPIKARDEIVGKLSIHGIESQDSQAIDLINAVAERLGTHIEGLRLSEQTARALIQTEQLSRQNELILGAAGEGIFGLDMNGNHTFVNETAAEMLGFTVDELIGRHSHTLWHHSHADGSPYPGEECPIYFTLRDGTVHQGDEYFLRKDGSGISVSFISTPIREGDRVTGAVVTFLDITERKATEERIRRQAERETLLNTISQKIQSATSVEAVLQIAARELGHALGAPLTIAQLGMKEDANA